MIFLQEIWLGYHEVRLINESFSDFTFKIATPDMFHYNEDKLLKTGQVWHGVAIGWHKELNTDITSLESNHERLVGIKLKKNACSYLLISFYAPTAGHDDDFLESLDYLSEFIEQNTEQGDGIVIGTDINCSEKSSARRKDSWVKFLNNFSLTVNSNGQPTFHHHNGTSNSCIDIFSASSNLQLTNFKEYCTLDTPLNLSSHDPISSNLMINASSENQESKFSHTYTDFNRQKIVWDTSKIEEYKHLTTKALSDASKFWNMPEAIPLLCQLYSNLLVKCSELVFNTKSAKITTNMKLPKSLIEAEAKLERTFNIWKKAGRPNSKANTSRQCYTSARSELQRLRRSKENLQHIKKNNFLMYSNIHDKNKVFSVMKKERGVTSNSVTSLLETPTGIFHGDDVLEGFASDAEFLGKPNPNSSWLDHSFYRLCKLDNIYIFEFEENLKITPMSLSQLEHILSNKMKSSVISIN